MSYGRVRWGPQINPTICCANATRVVSKNKAARPPRLPNDESEVAFTIFLAPTYNPNPAHDGQSDTDPKQHAKHEKL
jgi:hypothetical protein